MYRKRIKGMLIICTFVIFGITGELLAQNNPVAQNNPASVAQNPGSISEVSLKKSKIPESQPIRGEDILWQRDVYRMVDLTVGQNAALLYPVEPTGSRMNLFSMMFDVVANGKLTTYEYLDGREIFTDLYAIKFKDLLKRFEIPFREKNDPKKPNATIFEIDAVDIPSSEVTLFYLKEIWYLDQRNSSIKVKTMALCPVLIRTDEMGETRRHPMFWIPFETLKPYLSQLPIAADSLNSATRISVYDFFNQRRYQGDIYKVSNLKNQTIWDYCKTPEEIKIEQIRLEKELKDINNSLWDPSQKLLREEEALQKEKAIKNPIGKKKK